MTHSSSTLPALDDLEQLRHHYMSQIIHAAASNGRPVQAAPYVLASSAAERRGELAVIEAYAIAAGIRIAPSWFADAGPLPSIGKRSGWQAAREYAQQGYAHGIVAIARSAITTDPREYAALLDDLFAHRLFLTFLPTEDNLVEWLPFRASSVSGVVGEGAQVPVPGSRPLSHVSQH